MASWTVQVRVEQLPVHYCSNPYITIFEENDERTGGCLSGVITIYLSNIVFQAYLHYVMRLSRFYVLLLV